MKPAILSCIMCLSVLAANAQSYYKIGEHTISTTVDNTTHTYKYSNDDFYIKLHNTTNKYNDIPIKYINGNSIKNSEMVLSNAFTTDKGYDATKQEIIGYIDSVIMKVDSEIIRKDINHREPLFIVLAVSASTGQVEEISYTIPVGDGFDRVSPKAYYNIDKILKEKIQFHINEIGKQLNYLPISFRIYLPEKK